jgi:hypothetical protein
MGSGIAQVNESGIGAFVQQLRELGWLEGQNIVIELRSAEGSFARASGIFAVFDSTTCRCDRNVDEQAWTGGHARDRLDPDSHH